MDRMARYHLGGVGKGLRGQLALAEGANLELDFQTCLTWATVCELLHNAALIHDDIQDNDPVRRGQPSLWKKFGVAQAINTGDFLIFRAFKLASQLGSLPLIGEVSHISELLVQGQAGDIEQTPFDSAQGYWPAYLKMAELKTGTLFQLPIQGIHQLKYGALEGFQARFWLDLGICYQIMDDIRDYKGQKQKGQKQKDFEEKKMNALIAWLSQLNEHRGLMEDYLAMGSSPQLLETIESQKVIQNLQAYLNKKLEVFKLNTAQESQKVVLNFIENSSP